MADKAVSNISASILHDEIKTAIGGDLNYEPADSDDKWVFADLVINNTSSDLLPVRDFLGKSEQTHTSYKVRWMCIKNLSTKATDGICICLDGATAAYNLGTGIYIGAGEIVTIKAPNTTLANLHAVSVTMDGTYGYPLTSHTGSVSAQVAAIIEDVA